jgi:thioredoxin 1
MPLDFSPRSGYHDNVPLDVDKIPGDIMADLTYVSEDTFQNEVLDSSQPVVVDFTAVWCGPCKMLDPVVKQLADEWAGKAKIVKLDVDHNPNLTIQYGVMGVPTLMLFVSGKESQRITGYQPKDRIIAKFKPHL